jgi:transcription antitermination factor NusB
MMGKRRAARELALRLLFQMDVGNAPLDDVLASLDQRPHNPETIEFARLLLQGADAQRAVIDEVLERYAREWSLDRMASVDRNVLRIATYEILFLPEIPPSVSVDEAVEMVKKYSTGESGKFVNGILGNLVRHLDEEQARARSHAAGQSPQA